MDYVVVHIYLFQSTYYKDLFLLNQIPWLPQNPVFGLSDSGAPDFSWGVHLEVDINPHWKMTILVTPGSFFPTSIFGRVAMDPNCPATTGRI